MFTLIILRWMTLIFFICLLLIYFKGGLSVFRDLRLSIKTTHSYRGSVLILCIMLSTLVFLTHALKICLSQTAHSLLFNYYSIRFTTNMILSLLCVASLSTALGFWIQVHWQPKTTATAAAALSAGPVDEIPHPIPFESDQKAPFSGTSG